MNIDDVANILDSWVKGSAAESLPVRVQRIAIGVLSRKDHTRPISDSIIDAVLYQGEACKFKEWASSENNYMWTVVEIRRTADIAPIPKEYDDTPIYNLPYLITVI